MSQANVEVIRRLFDGYRRGDYAEAAECLAAHIVYEVGQELPARGREEVRAMWERWDSTWDELETVPEEFIDAGQQVLVTVHYSARGRGSGIEYEERLFDVYIFSDGQTGVQRAIRGPARSGTRLLVADGCVSRQGAVRCSRRAR